MLAFTNMNRECKDIGELRENQFEDRNDARVIVPRLDLDISEDESGFDHINKLFSVEEQSRGVERCKAAKEVAFYTGRNYGSIPSERIAKQSHSESINNETNMWQNTDNTIKGDRTVLLNHLKLLDSLEDSKDNDSENFRKNLDAFLEVQTIGHCIGNSKRQKINIDGKDLLKISLQSLDRYFHVLSMKINEVKSLTDNLHSEEAKNHALQQTVNEYEKEMAEMTSKNDKENQFHQNNIHKIKLKKDFVPKEIQEEAEKCKTDAEKWKGRNKQKIDEILKKTVDATKQLGKLMSRSKEDKHMNEKDVEKQIKRQKENITDAKLERSGKKHGVRQVSQDEKKTMENPLKEKQTENYKLSQTLMKMEETSRDVIRYLREDILSKDKQLIEVQEMYEKQFMIAQLYKAILSKREEKNDKAKKDSNRNVYDKMADNRTEVEKSNKNVPLDDESKLDLHLLDLHPSVNCIDSLEASVIKQRFVELLKCQTLNKSISDLLKEFPVLREDDMCKEGILWHENSIEKLREMQNMRKNLIKTRQELEKTMEENLELKENIKHNKKLGYRWKDLLNEKLLETQRKDGEIENLKLEMLKHKQEASALSKQLQKSCMIQNSKDKEIEMLNFSVKLESDTDYCIITRGSMENFKRQIKKEREENKYLLKYCDEMDEKISQSKRDLEICKKNNGEFEKREQFLQERVAEMTSKVASKNCFITQLKEKIKELQMKNESREEEINDKKHEIDLCNIKIEKLEERLVHTEELYTQLENENSTWRKKILHEQCGDCTDRMNQIKKLNEEKRMIKVQNEELTEELEQLKCDKEDLIAKFKEMAEEHKYEIDKYEMKLENVWQELGKEENKHRDRQNEFTLLMEDVKHFQNKMEYTLGERDLEKIENEIYRVKEEVIILNRENRDLKNVKGVSDDKSEKWHKKINELKAELKEVEEENDRICGELKKRDKEIEDKDRLLKDLKARLDVKMSKDEERRYPKKDMMTTIIEETSSRLQKGTHYKVEFDNDLKYTNRESNVEDSSRRTAMKLSSNKNTNVPSCYVTSGHIETASNVGSHVKRKVPSWMTDESSRIEMTPAENKNQIDPGLHDSLDDFVFKEKKPQSVKRNDGKDENWTKRIRNKERKRGQSLNDAADELKRMVEFDF